MTVRTDATREAASAPIENRHIVARGESFGSSYIGVIGNALTVSEIRRTRRFARPNAIYGLRYIPGAVAAGNHRPEAGLDLYVVERDGNIGNSSTASSVEAEPSTDDRPVVAMFGGSTMMGMGSRLPEFTIPSLTERLLLEEHGVEVRCKNFGIGGTTSLEALSLLMHEVAPQKPRIIVFYDGWNDCSYFTTLAALAKNPDSTLSLAARQAVDLRQLEINTTLPTLFSPSRALALAARLGASSMASGIGAAMPLPLRRRVHGLTARLIPLGIHRELLRMRGHVSDDDLANAAPDAARKFASIHAVAKFVSHSCGAEFVHVLQPLTLWGRKPLTDREQWFASSGRSTGSTAAFEPFRHEVIRGLGDGLVDFTDTFANELAEVYTDSGHLNRLGNLLVATQLARLLATRLGVQT